MFQDESFEVSGLSIGYNTTITYKISNPHFTGISGNLIFYEEIPDNESYYYGAVKYVNPISIPVYVKGRSAVVETIAIPDYHPAKCVFITDDGKTETRLRRDMFPNFNNTSSIVHDIHFYKNKFDESPRRDKYYLKFGLMHDDNFSASIYNDASYRKKDRYSPRLKVTVSRLNSGYYGYSYTLTNPNSKGFYNGTLVFRDGPLRNGTRESASWSRCIVGPEMTVSGYFESPPDVQLVHVEFYDDSGTEFDTWDLIGKSSLSGF